MRTRWKCLSLAVFAASSLGSVAATPQGPAEERFRPLVVELFTSQGCSSCPPADQLLPELQSRVGDAAGVEIVPLSFHVDYWNRLGWQDPFSEEAFSVRQRQYAAWMDEGRVYTPQLVLGGREHCVGSDLDCIAAGIERQLDLPRSVVDLAVRRVPAGAHLDVTIRNSSAEVPLLVWGLIRQRGLETAVTSGENAQRTLRNDFVVRRLTVLGELPTGMRGKHFESRLALAEAWGDRGLDVVVFLQDPGSGAIYGATQVELR